MILHASPVIRPRRSPAHLQQRRRAGARDVAYPIPFILLPLSTVYFRQQRERHRFIDRAELIHLQNQEDTSARAFTKENLRLARTRARSLAAEKSRNIPDDFAITLRSTQAFFVGARRGYFARAIGILRRATGSIYNFVNGHSPSCLPRRRDVVREACSFLKKLGARYIIQGDAYLRYTQNYITVEADVDPNEKQRAVIWENISSWQRYVFLDRERLIIYSIVYVKTRDVKIIVRTSYRLIGDESIIDRGLVPRQSLCRRSRPHSS